MNRNADRPALRGRDAAAPASARHRFVIPGLQLAHLAWFASTVEAGFDAVALVVSATASAGLYAWFLIVEYRYGGYRPSPILFYLAAGIFRLGTGVVFIVVAATTDEWELLLVGLHDVSAYLMHGHWLALLGDWCVVVGYFLVASRFRPRPPAPATVPSGLWGRTWTAGLLTAAASLAWRFAQGNVELGGIGMLTSFVADYGPAAGVWLMLAASRQGEARVSGRRAGIALVFLGVDLLDGLFSYMKTNVFIALLPLVLVALDRAPAELRSRGSPPLGRSVAAIGLLAWFFLFVVPSYAPERRAMLMESGIVENPGVRYVVPMGSFLAEAALASIPGTAAFQEAHRFPNGAWALIARMSVTAFPAWAYHQVETAGSRDESFFEELLVSVTPRIVWPDKPEISFGRDFAVTVVPTRSPDSTATSLAITLQGAYYWWGGYFALLLGCALTGAVFAGVWLLFRDQCLLNPASALVGLVLFNEGFRWFESAALGWFPMFLYLVIVFTPLQFVARRALGYRWTAPADG